MTRTINGKGRIPSLQKLIAGNNNKKTSTKSMILVQPLLLLFAFSGAFGFQTVPICAPDASLQARHPSCTPSRLALGALYAKGPTTEEERETKTKSLYASLKKKLKYPILQLKSSTKVAPPDESSLSIFSKLKATLKKPLSQLKSLFGSQEEELEEDILEGRRTKPRAVEHDVMADMMAATAAIQASATAKFNELVTGQDRSATAAPRVDLSGNWNVVVTEEFKKEYDRYLTYLGQPNLVRSVALSIVGLTTEETKQLNKGRELFIRGRNVRGVWERTLVASDSADPVLTPITTADSEKVVSESWWTNGGTVHVSWLRGVKKYGGGDFESRRSIDSDGIFICESTFHPQDGAREKVSMTWRFQRQ